MEGRVVDPLNKIERQVQGFQEKSIHEPICRHESKFIAPEQQFLQFRETYKRLTVARLYPGLVQIENHQGRPESRETVPFIKNHQTIRC